MKPTDFDLHSGVKHMFWELAVTGGPVDPVRDHLGEDLIQVVLDRGTIVDVGWYPEFSRDGCFRLLIVADQNWLEPVQLTECRTLAELKEAFTKCLDFARALEQK